MRFALACPSCRSALADAGRALSCAPCDALYRHEGGLWDFVRAPRRALVDAFARRYTRVREAEGRRLEDARAAWALPFRDRAGKHTYEWFVRRESFATLLRAVIVPFERTRPGRLRIVDAGSGVGWLAYRLALRGHDVAAVDAVTGDVALGAQRFFPGAFVPLRAELDALPLATGSVDLVVYDASIHYATDLGTSLREGLRVLAPGGGLAIVDSPLYRARASGHAMKRERDHFFAATYGFDADPSAGFLTYDDLATFGAAHGVRWGFVRPSHGLRWRLKPWLARLRGTREPAAFDIAVGHRTPS